MKLGRCQPLYQRWQAVVRTQADRPAVHLIAEERVLTFGELHAACEILPPAGSVVHAEGKGLFFLLAVLQAWRDDAVLLPTETASTLTEPEVSRFPPDVCHLKTTSGSTGTPRQILFSADQLLADADQILQTMGLRQEWPNIAVISMAHSYGFSNLVLPLLLHGIPLIIADSPLPQAMRKALAQGHDFTLAAVPAMWRAWHAAGLIDGRIRLAISAGAPLSLDLECAIFATSGVKLHNFYGSSECGGIAYDRSTEPRRDALFVGTALENVELELDAVTECLTVRSAAVGYRYDEPTASLCDGRFLTSDRVRLANGMVWLEGREGESINVAGRKISPSIIEEKILTLPGVRHSVVFGIPSLDAVRVDEIVACVNLANTVTLETIRHACAHLLPASEQPRHWRHWPELAPDGRGKISRVLWRERFLTRRTAADHCAGGVPLKVI